MPKTRAKKKDEVEQLVNKVKTSQSVIIAKLEGLKVNDAQELRKNLRKEDAQIVVVKKTLLKKSLEELKYELPDLTRLEGIIGIAFAQDEVTAAKILKDFSKTHPQVELSSGYLDGKVLDQVSV
ncbi:50S ribosomal protein L10, partial [Patescibacteria group bacterium]|nr:50S ribosomal protein L10 [Patescibacteria group bacterium]MBU1890279.1 50S ribosomal protein L10 [Patescibacteria group bacterium]